MRCLHPKKIAQAAEFPATFLINEITLSRSLQHSRKRLSGIPTLVADLSLKHLCRLNFLFIFYSVSECLLGDCSIITSSLRF